MIGGPTSDIYIEKFEGAGTAGITHNGIEITPTTYVIYLNPNNGDRINVRVRTKEFEKYVSFTNVKLVVKAPYYEANRVLYLTKETSTVSNDNQRLGNFTTEDGLTFEYDLSKYFEENDRETLYFAIRTETAIQILGPAHADGIKVIFNRLEQCQGLINQKFISGNAGRALSYDINLRTGQPFFVKNLVSAGGNLMPMNLNLVFNGIGANEEIFTGMPHGWKTNYHQRIKLIEGTNQYSYIDALGIRHTFNKALNANNIYFDIAGTGFILTVNSDNTVTIDQGYKNYLHFNSGGWLISINKVDGIKSVTTYIEYDEDTNNINKIKDGAGRELSFAYNTNNIKINMAGISEITLNISNSKLVSVTECGGRISTYNYEEALLINATSDNGEISKFIYDDNCRVVTVEDYYKNTETIVNKRNIKYIISKTIVTDYKGIETQFGFSNEGECISEFEVTGEGFGRYELTLPNNFETFKNIVNKNKYIEYGDKGVNCGREKASVTKVASNFVPDQREKYLLTFNYQIQGYCTVFNDSARMIQIYQANTLINTIYLDYKVDYVKNVAVLLTPISDDIFEIYISSTDDSSIAAVTNIKLFELMRETVRECVSFSYGTGWAMTHNQGAWNQIIDNMSFSYYDNETNSSKQLQEKMFLVDIYETQDNYKRNPNCYHTWYNKKRGLIANTKNVTFISNTGNYSIGGFNAALVCITDKGIYWKYNTYPTTVSDPVNLRYEIETILRRGVYNSSRKVIDMDYRVVSGEDFDGVDYSYTYKPDEKKTIYSYGSGYYKITTINQYSDDLNYLMSHTSYVGNGQASITSYSYDSLGRVLAITKPNGSVVNYVYNSDTGELKEVYETVNGVTNKNEINYQKDNIVDLLSTNKGYSFEYDKYNLLSSVKMNSNGVKNSLLSFYNQFSNTLDTTMVRYGDSYVEENTYDKYGNLTLIKSGYYGSTLSNDLEIYYSDEKVDLIEANDPNSADIKKTSRSKLRKVIDKKTNNSQEYHYSADGLLYKIINSSIHNLREAKFTYDDLERPTNKKISDANVTSSMTITYKDSNLKNINEVSEIENEVNHKYNDISYCMTYSKSFNTDSFKRLSNETLQLDNYSCEKIYTYSRTELRNTQYPNIITYNMKYLSTASNLGSITYTYDNIGNITKIVDTVTNNEIAYKYDLLGRLIREDNQKLGITKLFTYDLHGNITSIKSTDYTTSTDLSNIVMTDTTFAYNSTYPNRMITYNGTSVSDNVNGNMLNISNYSFSWTRGRLLSSCTKSGMNYTFSYNALGQRIQKRHSSTNYINYTYDGNKLIKEHRVTDTETYDIDYIYLGDEMVGFAMKNKFYYFVKNLQGDIIKLVNSTNNVIATYVYDAWGNCKVYNSSGVESTSSTWVGNINPIRYRGYYYDVETQLFYCNSRYYSPELCRWISPDSIEYLDPQSINGLNLYCYCYNNPISYSDPSGNLPQWAKWAIGAGVIAILAVATVLTAGAAGVGVGAAFAAGFAGSAIGVGASGLAVTIAGSAFAGAVIGAGFGLIGGALVGGISSGSWSGALEGAANGFMMGSITGAISGGIRGGINYARTSPLIRSVSADELNSIKSTGQFSSSGYSESKWFATNSTDASKWANWFGQSDYVGIRVPKSAFKNFYFNPVLDNIGPAYNIEIGYLNSILKGIWYF